jgi:hypothetical protein
MRTETPWGVWEPLTPIGVRDLMAPIAVPWWIAGGHAIEAFVGDAFRAHVDVDVGIFRDDQLRARAALADWDAHCADPPGSLRPWPIGERLPRGVHDVWLRERPDAPWRFQWMLNERDGGDWVSRRDPRTRVPIANLGFERDGIRYLAPQIQLLFKAKNAREKDEADFARAQPLLSEEQRAWLRERLEAEQPGHPWLVRLRG